MAYKDKDKIQKFLKRSEYHRGTYKIYDFGDCEGKRPDKLIDYLIIPKDISREEMAALLSQYDFMYEYAANVVLLSEDERLDEIRKIETQISEQLQKYQHLTGKKITIKL